MMPDPTPGSDGNVQIQASVVNGWRTYNDRVGPTIINSRIQGTGNASCPLAPCGATRHKVVTCQSYGLVF